MEGEPLFQPLEKSFIPFAVQITSVDGINVRHGPLVELPVTPLGAHSFVDIVTNMKNELTIDVLYHFEPYNRPLPFVRLEISQNFTYIMKYIIYLNTYININSILKTIIINKKLQKIKRKVKK